MIIKFWLFGLVVGREGVKADLDWQVLAGFQYGLVAFGTILIGPLLEEVLFRRYFYEMLASLYSRVMAFGLTVCITTLLHWHLDTTLFAVFWHFVSACIFTFAYIKSRLGVSVILHSFNNTLAVLLSR